MRSIAYLRMVTNKISRLVSVVFAERIVDIILPHVAIFASGGLPFRNKEVDCQFNLILGWHCQTLDNNNTVDHVGSFESGGFSHNLLFPISLL